MATLTLIRLLVRVIGRNSRHEAGLVTAKAVLSGIGLVRGPRDRADKRDVDGLVAAHAAFFRPTRVALRHGQNSLIGMTREAVIPAFQFMRNPGNVGGRLGLRGSALHGGLTPVTGEAGRV